MRDSVEAAYLKTYLAANIPLTQHMGLLTINYTISQLAIQAALAPNMNHQKTAFGGSLATLCTVAAWGWLVLYLRSQAITNVNVVISHSEVTYLKPVTRDFTARCLSPSQLTLDKLMKCLQRHKKAKLQLSATIEEEAHLAVSFQASFAVIMI